MNISTPISHKLAALGISHNVAAPFIGITVNWMWDISDSPSEAWNTLSLIQLCRLLILLHLDVDQIMAEDIPSNLPELDTSRDSSGIVHVAGAIRLKLYASDPKSVKLDWDSDDIKRWLSDDEELADIPVPALDDICRAVELDTASVIRQYLTKMGHAV